MNKDKEVIHRYIYIYHECVCLFVSLLMRVCSI